jgi:hypothetical protein
VYYRDEKLKWLLPIPLNLLTDADMYNIYVAETIKAYHLSAVDAFKVYPVAPRNWKSMITGLSTAAQDLLFDNLSPSVRPSSRPAFYSTVITYDDHCPYNRKSSWKELKNVNRYSSVSALRQLLSFQTDAVIFGLIFRNSRARIQLTWYENPHERGVSCRP